MPASHGYAERDEDPGQGRMHSGLQHGSPEHDAEQDVSRDACDARAVHADG